MVEEYYKQQVAGFTSQWRNLKRKSRNYLYGKLFFFLAALVLGYNAYSSSSLLTGTMAALSFLLYLLFYIRDIQCVGRIKTLGAFKQVCENELAAIHEDFSAFDDGEAFVDSHHEYSFDLDLFGPHSLYQRVNRTVTEMGGCRLAHSFSHLDGTASEIVENQKAIAELSAMADWRIRFMANTKVQGDMASLVQTIAQEQYGKFLLHSSLPWLTVPLAWGMLALAVAGVLPWAGFLLMFSIQIGITMSVGRVSSRTSQQIDLLHKAFKGYLPILESLKTAHFKTEKLSALTGRLFDGDACGYRAFRQLSTLLSLFNQRSNELVSALLNGLLLYDVFVVRRFARWHRSYLAQLPAWLDAVAELDKMVSWGNYAFNHPHNVPAEILPADSEYAVRAEGVYHPFLNEHKAVPNDFDLQKRHVAIVTGANMAGKSTFLRTMGVTYLLACNGVPVCAKSFRFSVVSLFSSMRTADDLSQNISYFNAELLRLKQLLHHVKTHDFTLIILDEILKGTNSRDKLKGSVMFLEEISKYNVSVVVATHDLELSKMEDRQPEVYSNYCFEIDLSENVQYSYKIARGVAKNLNASYLLQNILKDA